MRKKSMKCLLALLVFGVLFSGCASIVSKTRYPLTINSTPNNAKIEIMDKYGRTVFSGNTPAIVSLKSSTGYFSKAQYTVRFSSPGYDDRIVPVTFDINGWYFGNIIFGGLIGLLIVDPATGAMWRIDINYLNETLNPSSRTVMEEGNIKIMDINDIPENWKEHLVEVK